MTKRDIRIGHLITPFGPGSIYTDRDGIPYVIAGLDHWFPPGRGEPGTGFCVREFEIDEPRLAGLLRVGGFRRPPDFRAVRRGARASDNAALKVPVLRFPCWYRNSKSGVLHRFSLHTRRLQPPSDGGKWRPVRFVAVCEEGHLCDFPWKAWIGCTCAAADNLVLDDRGGDDLSSVSAHCRGCNKRRSLAGAMSRPSSDEAGAFLQAGINCPGARPWLGEIEGPGCPAQLVGALINQTNIHFADVMSSIRLPQGSDAAEPVRKLAELLLDPAVGCPEANMAWKLGLKDPAIAQVAAELAKRGIEASVDDIREALASLWDGSRPSIVGCTFPVDPESPAANARREEFTILREPFADAEVDFLQSIRVAVPDDLTQWLDRVILVEKLRETRAFYGFSRLVPKADRLSRMPSAAMSQLFKDPPAYPAQQWLPAVIVQGEGIFLELREDAIKSWQARCEDMLRSRISDEFVQRMYAVPQILMPQTALNREWASRYLLVHTLAHVLINQLVFECGYSTASLRERLYISADATAPMAGILIYTAAGDSDGTLGGLVRQGFPELLEPMVRRALSKAWWCAADPVCSESLGGTGARMANLAGCHGCVLLPETSCETINNGLDRAMLVGIPADRSFGFMTELVQDIEVGDSAEPRGTQ